MLTKKRRYKTHLEGKREYTRKEGDGEGIEEVTKDDSKTSNCIVMKFY